MYQEYSSGVIPLASRYLYIVAETSWPNSKSSDRNRRSFMKCACCTMSGDPGCTYSVLSLNRKIASGRRSKIVRIASIDARTEFLIFVTNAASDISRSFHHPHAAENCAVM